MEPKQATLKRNFANLFFILRRPRRMADDYKIPEIDMSILENDPLFAAIQAMSNSAQQSAEALLASGQLENGIDSIDFEHLSQEILSQLSPEHVATLLNTGENSPPED